MKMLVTGGVGFVGTNLIKRLLKDGHEVVSIDNYSTGKKENEQDGCIYYDYDLSYSYIRDDGDSYDVIFHLAALARIQPSLKHPYKTIYNNFTSTLHILEYGRKNDVKVIYAGSSSIHGGAYKNPYTFTKWQGDKLCHLYSETLNFPVNVCRFYNVYGPHHLTEGEYCTVVGIFQTQYQSGEELTITGDGEQRRDFTHVDDIVDGLMRCSEHFTFMGEEFELGYGENFSINVIADSFDSGKEYIDARPGEACDTLCTDKKAHKLLGWKPTRNILDYIEDFKNEIDFVPGSYTIRHNTQSKKRL